MLQVNFIITYIILKSQFFLKLLELQNVFKDYNSLYFFLNY